MVTTKRILDWVIAAVLVCSVGVFPACTKADGPDDTGKSLLIK